MGGAGAILPGMGRCTAPGHNQQPGEVRLSTFGSGHGGLPPQLPTTVHALEQLGTTLYTPLWRCREGFVDLVGPRVASLALVMGRAR